MSQISQAGDGNRFSSQYPVAVLNATGEIIPPYGVMQVASASVVGTDRVFNVVKPNGSATAKYLLNGPAVIDAGRYGGGTDHYPAIAAYIGTPVNGAEWGPVAGSWALSVNGKGFLILGGATNGLVHVAAKGGVSAGDDFPLVKIVNVSGLDKPYGTIFGYGPPVDPPPATLFRIPTFQSAPPTAGKPFCVSLSPIANGDTGDAGPVGIVACQLDFTDAAHTKADCVTGDYAKLKSAADGPATIVWRELQGVSGGGSLGVQWARVLLDRGGGGGGTNQLTLAIVYSQIAAATVNGSSINPGMGLIKKYTRPSTPGDDWVFVDSVVTAWNTYFDDFPANAIVWVDSENYVVGVGCTLVG